MKCRCKNPNTPVWHHYGGRGIRYSQAWEDFDSFYRDMGDCPPGFSLDRIDNEGDYSPDNCRWASRGVQEGNKRKRRGCSSAFRGVSWNKKQKVWKSKITNDGRETFLGNFSSEVDAALAYNGAAIALGRPLNDIAKGIV